VKAVCLQPEAKRGGLLSQQGERMVGAHAAELPRRVAARQVGREIDGRPRSAAAVKQRERI
jgi:hypothetical protein